jgi:hypothetical protein
LIELWDILKGAGYQYVFTRRLNQDCLDNLFGSIRQKSGRNFNPNPIHFLEVFKTLFSIKILNSETENCPQDHDQVLLRISDMPEAAEPQNPKQIVLHESTTTQEPVIDRDYQNCDVLQKTSAFLKHMKMHPDISPQQFRRGRFTKLEMPDDNFVFFFAMLE